MPRTPARPSTRRKSSALRFILPLLGVIALFAAAGCYDNNTGETVVSDDIRFKLPAFPETGSNKIQIFTEMHYQPSYRSQEGPRLMPPDGSVPITGAEIVRTSVEEYKAMSDPGGDAGRGADLYALNCLVCHGERLDGGGPVMVHDPNMAPADLRANMTSDRSDGEMFGIISFGGNTGFTVRVASLANPNVDPDQCVNQATCPMPEFRKLLTEAERWDLVAYLRNMQGR